MSTEITLTPEMVEFIEAMVTETETDSCSQPVAVDDVNGRYGYGSHHNTAQRDFMGHQAYLLAVAIRRQRGEGK